MWNLILLGISLHFLNANSIEEKISPKFTHPFPELNLPNVAAYIEYFKDLMLKDIDKKLNNLTDEMKQINVLMEDYITGFARDLRETIEVDKNNVSFEEHQIIEDYYPGQTDPIYDEIKNRLRIEHPDITEKTVDEIIYKLRLNLYDTRTKLMDIMYLIKSRSQGRR